MFSLIKPGRRLFGRWSRQAPDSGGIDVIKKRVDIVMYLMLTFVAYDIMKGFGLVGIWSPG